MGSAFVRYCESEKLAYRNIGRKNYNECINSSCDILINANGNSKKYLADQQPIEDFDAAVRSVRMSLADFKPNLYVYISSCDVYSECSNPQKNAEDAPMAVDKQSRYGFHKFLAELCVRHSGLNWLIFRMGGFVGPGLKKNPIFDILHGNYLWLHKDSELQFMKTDDAARIIFEIAKKGYAHQFFNLCGDGVIRLNDVMNMAQRFVPSPKDALPVRYEINIEKIKREVIIPKTSETVSRFVEDFLSAKQHQRIAKQ